MIEKRARKRRVTDRVEANEELAVVIIAAFTLITAVSILANLFI
jgi:hypothetical protein